MIRSYVTIAYRSMVRNKLFSCINVAGLSLGLSVSFLLFVHVKQELSYERHVPGKALVYRAASVHWAKVSPLLAGALKRDFPEVNTVARLHFHDPMIVTAGDAITYPQHIYYADPSVIDVFRFQFLRGNPHTALNDPASIVITESIASKLFPAGEDPMGKNLILDGYMEHTVAGIIKDIPAATHLKIDCLLSMQKSGANDSDSKTWKAVSTYIRFNDANEAATVTARLRDFEYHFYDGVRNKDEIDRDGDFFTLDPIDSIHLNSHKEKEAEANSDMMYIYVFSAFGLLIILIASINFINLFTAQAVRRIREIGIRKAIGAHRSQLIAQFMSEAFFMVLLSTLIATASSFAVMPWYNQLAAVSLSPASLYTVDNLSLIGILMFLTALLSGAYPAWIISSQSALKSFQGVGDVSVTRKTLVSIQFIFSMFLLATTAIIYSQLDYIRTKDLGFNREEVVAVKLYGKQFVTATEHREALRDQLLSNSNIKEISLTSRIVGERLGWESLQLTDLPKDSEISARYLVVDERFLQTMGIELLEGTNFIGEPDTIPSYIINQAAAASFHVENLVGRSAVNTANDHPAGRIVGIVKDFNFASLRGAVEPLMIEYQKQYPDYLLVRINSHHRQEAIRYLEETINKAAPGSSVIYSFLDEKLDALYQRDNTLYQSAKVFAIATVIIAVLGLFALAAHAAESRTKEIGIRRVLGASVKDVVVLLGSDFMKLILMSVAGATPVAFYAGSKWLKGFSYQVDITWWMFVVPAVAIVFLAFVAVLGQSLGVANSNPVDSLKHE